VPINAIILNSFSGISSPRRRPAGYLVLLDLIYTVLYGAELDDRWLLVTPESTENDIARRMHAAVSSTFNSSCPARCHRLPGKKGQSLFHYVSCIQRLSATLGFKGFGRCFKI